MKGAGIHGVAKASIIGGNFHHPHGKRHRCRVLACDVHEITAQDTVGIKAQVVVGLTLLRCSRDRTDAGGHVEDRHQRRFVAKAIPQTLLLRPNTLVPVDVEPNNVDPIIVESVKGLTQQAIVDGPAETLDVGLFNADQGDGSVSARWCRSLCGDEVVHHQIHRLGQASTPQQCQHQSGSGVWPDTLQQFTNAFHPCR